MDIIGSGCKEAELAVSVVIACMKVKSSKPSWKPAWWLCSTPSCTRFSWRVWFGVLGVLKLIFSPLFSCLHRRIRICLYVHSGQSLYKLIFNWTVSYAGGSWIYSLSSKAAYFYWEGKNLFKWLLSFFRNTQRIWQAQYHRYSIFLLRMYFLGLGFVLNRSSLEYKMPVVHILVLFSMFLSCISLIQNGTL